MLPALRPRMGVRERHQRPGEPLAVTHHGSYPRGGGDGAGGGDFGTVFAREVARLEPTALVAASAEPDLAETVQAAFSGLLSESTQALILSV